MGVQRINDLDLSRSSGDGGPDHEFLQRRGWKTVSNRPIVIMGHYWKPYTGSATDQSDSLHDDLERSKVIGHGLQ